MRNIFIRHYILIPAVYLMIVTLASLPELLSGQAQHDPIQEEVTVTNIEVPVRVIHKGKPVSGLKKEDFVLLENKKRMAINGFFEKRKKIRLTGSKEIEEAALTLGPPRTFVLVFRITDFNDYLVNAVDHMFDNVLRDNDRLLLLANDQTFEFPKLGNRTALKTQLIRQLRDQSRKARRALIKYINEVETALNVHDFFNENSLRPGTPVDRLLQFMKKYLIIWNDYKTRYLTPRVDRFYYFARYLEKIKGEKWVFNFYQFDLFPRIRLGSKTMDKLRDVGEELLLSRDAGNHSKGRLLTTLLNQTLVDLNVSKGVPAEEISKLFYKVDATFHSFFIKGLNKVGANDLEYDEVAGDVERTLKEITKATGGESIVSNNLVKSIDTVSELEDTYYILTYVPADPHKSGKIKIKVKGRKYNVLYDDNFRANYIEEYMQKMDKKIEVPEIKIKGFSFKSGVLAFSVSDYLMKKIGEQEAPEGKMKVRIVLTGSGKRAVFDQEKVLNAQAAEMKVSLGAFKTIEKGDYEFRIEAMDMLTGKTDSLYRAVTVGRK